MAVNYEKKSWHGVVVSPGQIITSTRSLAKETKLSHQTVRTALNNLTHKLTPELTQRTTSNYTIITVLNWSKYQNPTHQLTHQLTTTKEVKKKEQKSNDNKMLKLEPDETELTLTEDGEVIKGGSPAKAPELSIKNFNAVRTYFADGYQKAHGTRPLAQSGEYPNFVRVRKQYDGKQIKEIIDFYILSEKAKSHPSFNACMSGHTISLWEQTEYKNNQKYR
jgi:DNA-binding transcriptional regulator YhcF (GntR family)